LGSVSERQRWPLLQPPPPRPCAVEFALSAMAMHSAGGQNGGGGGVTTATRALLQRMKETLTCTACHEIFRDPCSLPCQHHHCRGCIEEYLELNTVCRQCRNKFWASELRPNASLASLVTHYKAMEEWVEGKQRNGGGGQGDERKGPHRRNGKRDDDEGDGGEDMGQRGGETKRGETTTTSRKGSPATRTSKPSSSASSSAQHTPRRTHAAAAAASSDRSPRASAAAAALFSSPTAAAAASSLVTPPRVSLKDAILAASSAPKSAPAPSATMQPRTERTSPGAATAAGSHSKNFNKQGFTKTSTAAPPVSVVAGSATARNRATFTTLFGEDSAPPASFPDSDSDIQELEPSHFRRNAAAAASPARPGPQLFSTAPSPALPALHGVTKTSSRPLGAANPRPGTIEGHFRNVSASKLSAAAAAALPPVPIVAPAGALPPATASMDADGDALMLAADVTRLVAGMRQQDLPTQMQNLSALSQLEAAAAAVVPPVNGAAVPSPPMQSSRSSTNVGGGQSDKSPFIPPSLAASTSTPSSPKMDHSPPLPASASASGSGSGSGSGGAHGLVQPHSGRQRSIPLGGGSLPPAPMPHTGSLSLPASQVPVASLTSASKDLFGSPPPLEHAPLIDIYSPPRPAAREEEEVSQSPAQSQAPPQPAPTIDPPPARVSLAKEVAALNRMADGTAAAPAAAAAALEPPPAVASPAPSAPSSQAAIPAASEAAPSQGDAASAYVSLLTQGSLAPAGLPVAMPSMAGLMVAAANPPAPGPVEPQSPSQRTAAVVSAPVTPLPAAAALAGGAAAATPRSSQQTAVTDAVFSPVRALSSATAVSTSAATAVLAPAAAMQSPPPSSTAPAGEATAHAAQPVESPLRSTPVQAAPADPMLLPTQPVANGDSPLIGIPPTSLSLVKDRPMVIAYTSLDATQTAELRAFCSQTQTTLLSGKAWHPGVTHVVCKPVRRVADSTCPGGTRAVTSRSLKYLQGLLVGAWVVEWAWVSASRQRGHWAAESDFEVAGDVAHLQHAATEAAQGTGSAKRARLREASGQPRLLRQVKIAVHPQLAKQDPSPTELQLLVQLGQGILIPTPPELSAAAAAGIDATGAVTGDSAGADANSTTALLSSGVSRLPAAAASVPGPIHLLCRSDAAVVCPPSTMARLGGRLGMLPLSVQWMLDSISLGQPQAAELFRCDVDQEHKAELRRKMQAQASAAAAAPSPTAAAAPSTAVGAVAGDHAQQQQAEAIPPTPPTLPQQQQQAQAQRLLAPIGS